MCFLMSGFVTMNDEFNFFGVRRKGWISGNDISILNIWMVIRENREY